MLPNYIREALRTVKPESTHNKNDNTVSAKRTDAINAVITLAKKAHPELFVSEAETRERCIAIDKRNREATLRRIFGK